MKSATWQASPKSLPVFLHRPGWLVLISSCKLTQSTLCHIWRQGYQPVISPSSARLCSALHLSRDILLMRVFRLVRLRFVQCRPDRAQAAGPGRQPAGLCTLLQDRCPGLLAPAGSAAVPGQPAAPPAGSRRPGSPLLIWSSRPSPHGAVHGQVLSAICVILGAQLPHAVCSGCWRLSPVANWHRISMPLGSKALAKAQAEAPVWMYSHGQAWQLMQVHQSGRSLGSSSRQALHCQAGSGCRRAGLPRLAAVLPALQPGLPACVSPARCLTTQACM